jgi:hypothetical protein
MKKLLALIFLCHSVYLSGYNITTWSSPTTISNSGADASDFHVGMDSSGNAVAIWIEDGLLVSATKIWNNAWSLTTYLSNTTATSAQIVVDSSGNASVIWIENNIVQGAYKPFGGSWTMSNPSSSATCSATQLAIDSSGNVIAIWVENGDIISSTKLSGGSWSSPDTLFSSNGDSPQIAIGNDGTVVAVWHALDSNSVNRIYASDKTLSSGTWSTAVAISNPDQHASYPQITVGPQGVADALWFSYFVLNGIYSNVVLESSCFPTADGTWSAPTSISPPGSMNPANLTAQIQNSNTGCVVAAWTNVINPSNYSIQAAIKTRQWKWSSVNLASSNPFAYSMGLSVTSVGSAVLPFMAYDSGSSSTVINVTQAYVGGYYSGSWAPITLISTGTSNGFPQAASIITSDQLQALAVVGWVNFNGTNNTIQAITGQGDLPSPPSNLAVSQSNSDWGVFNEYYNTITWDASTAPNLSGYVVYRDNAPLGFVSSAKTSFADTNQQQNGSVTYGISSLGNNTTEGAPATVSFP